MSPLDNNISYVPFPCQDDSAAAELPKTELCGQVITIVISSLKTAILRGIKPPRNLL